MKLLNMSPEKHSQSKKLSVLLGLVGALATFLSISFISRLLLFYSAPLFILIFIPFLAAIVTYIVTNFGIRLLDKNTYSRLGLTFIGGSLGMGAYIFVATVYLLLTLHPELYIRFGPSFYGTSFLLGGFLAPLIGAITAFIKSKPSV